MRLNGKITFFNTVKRKFEIYLKFEKKQKTKKTKQKNKAVHIVGSHF